MLKNCDIYRMIHLYCPCLSMRKQIYEELLINNGGRDKVWTKGCLKITFYTNKTIIYLNI